MADAPIYFVNPNAHWGGCLTAVCQGDTARSRVADLEKNPQLRVFRVRATISDAVSLAGHLPELLKSRPFRRIRLKEDPLKIHLHHGGWNAVYYSLVGAAESHLLDYIEVRVKTPFPRRALIFGRTAINRLLDTISVNWQLPLVIGRLDLLTNDVDDVVVSELVMPYADALEMGPLGGFDQSPLFTPWLGTLREAVTATSPYWRLLCAWRVYDGVHHLRARVKDSCTRLGITDSLPKDPSISVEELREAGIPEEFFHGVKKTSQLFERLRRMRDGVAHFLLKEGTQQHHVYFFERDPYTEYSIASTILLQAAFTAVKELQFYYSTHVESKTRIGSVSPERKHADKWIVYDPEFCPPLSEKDFSAS
jgi:hypothetical protein